MDKTTLTKLDSFFEKVDSKILEVSSLQSDFKAENDKYSQSLKVTLDTIPVECEVFELQRGDDKGFNVCFRTKIEGKEYLKWYGEGVGFNTDWYENIKVDSL